MTTIDEPDGVAEIGDADLVLRTRSGDRTAFGELWRRHYRSGITVARAISSSLDADDLVQEAYTKIYQSIQRGRGPTGSFRAYLFTTIRHTAAGWGRDRKETAMDVLDTVEDPSTSEEATDEALDRSLTHQAFRSLPTRWQEVLWYSEIEGMKPAEIAPLLGMKATAVAQLAFRAREGLREAWIQAHLRSVADGSDCQWTIERLGAYARNNLGRRDLAKVSDHLEECTRCAIVASEATEVGSRLALILLPLTIGTAGSAAYLASLQSGGVPALALAAMPSRVFEGAVVAPAEGFALVPVDPSVSGSATGSSAGGSATAGGSAAAGGSSAAGAAGATAAAGAGAGAAAGGAVAAGGILSSVGAVIGLAVAGVVVAGSIVAAAVVIPSMTSPPASAERAGVVETVTDDPDAAPLPLASNTTAPATAPTPTATDESVVVTPPPVPRGVPAPPTAPVRPAAPTVPDADPAAPSREPSATPTPSATPEPSITPTPEPSASPTPSTTPEPSVTPTPEPTPDPTPGPVLPDGTPTVEGTTLTLSDESGVVIAVHVSGAASSTMSVQFADEPARTVAFDADGRATVMLALRLDHVLLDPQLTLRYVAGDALGPALTASYRDLLLGGVPT